MPFRFAIKVDLLYNIMKCNLEEYAMNVIGKIGNFIMIYQEPLEIAAIAMLVVGVMVLIGKAIANAGKRQRLLNQISETVLEINTNVKSLTEKRTEVIYIDSRMTSEKGEPAPSVESKEDPVLETAQNPNQQEQSKGSEGEIEPAVKYFSRDCAVAKDGRQYTFEELDAQIRD